MLDLRYRDYGEELCKKEITSKEQPECSQVKSYFPNGRPVISTPSRWQVVAIHRGYDDHKAFEPHPDIYQYTHEERHDEIAPHFPDPENLRRQNVTTHHDIIT